MNIKNQRRAFDEIWVFHAICWMSTVTLSVLVGIHVSSRKTEINVYLLGAWVFSSVLSFILGKLLPKIQGEAIALEDLDEEIRIDSEFQL